MSSSNHAQDIELKEYFRRAERHPDRTGPVRREAFKRLLSLAQVQNSAHKKFVTEKVKDYFVDFPDLQDEAINAVYDMCEDQDQTIRIAGYGAITSVSTVDRGWLLRNADVLVQLLQSDDDKEVSVVKRALQEHVDLDPRSTLQVLADQCVFDAADLADEEERGLRARLRSLVLQFLAEKYRVCVARVVREPKVEGILLKGMIGAIPHASEPEVRMIIKDILIDLPCLAGGPTPDGNAVLDVLLSAARSALVTELAPSSPENRTNLKKTFSLLSLADFLSSPSSPAARPTPTGPAAARWSTSKPSPPANPSRLLQFYITLFSPPGPLAGDILGRRVGEEAKTELVDCVCGAYEAAMQLADRDQIGIDPVETRFAQVVTPPLLDLLTKRLSSAPSARDRSSLRPCLRLLRTVRERAPSSNSKESSPPFRPLEATLRTLQAALSPARGHVAGSGDAQTQVAGRPSTDEEAEVMDITRKILEAIEGTVAPSTRVQEQARERVQEPTREHGKELLSAPAATAFKRRFGQNRQDEARTPKPALAGRLSSPSVPLSVNAGDIAVRGAAALTRGDAMDVDGVEDVNGSPRARKRQRSDTPTLLSRLEPSSLAPTGPRAGSSSPLTGTGQTGGPAGAGALGSMGIAAHLAGAPDATGKLGPRSGTAIGLSGIGGGGSGGETTARARMPYHPRAPQAALSAGPSQHSRGDIAHGAPGAAGVSMGVRAGLLGAEMGVDGRGARAREASNALNGRESNAIGGRKPIFRRSGLPVESGGGGGRGGGGIEILGAAGAERDEIKIRGAARRGGDGDGVQTSNSGNSLLARLGGGGGGGRRAGDHGGDHGGDRKRKAKSARS
ncbi:hypothetical protein M0805_007697 [Coniferiporia weirii]|nr:hypothetical protein M0805_007697 [Coniferiporia weirii]